MYTDTEACIHIFRMTPINASRAFQNFIFGSFMIFSFRCWHIGPAGMHETWVVLGHAVNGSTINFWQLEAAKLSPLGHVWSIKRLYPVSLLSNHQAYPLLGLECDTDLKCFWMGLIHHIRTIMSRYQPLFQDQSTTFLLTEGDVPTDDGRHGLRSNGPTWREETVAKMDSYSFVFTYFYVYVSACRIGL